VVLPIFNYGGDNGWSEGGTIEEVAANLATAWNNLTQMMKAITTLLCCWCCRHFYGFNHRYFQVAVLFSG